METMKTATINTAILDSLKNENKYLRVVFETNFGEAYLSRSTSQGYGVEYTRTKEYGFSLHYFKDAKSFKGSIKRYVKQYGLPERILLNGGELQGTEDLMNAIIENL